MIKFKSYASSSKGNLYTVDDGKTKLMLECGLPIKKIKEELNFKVHEISACLISHQHEDHSRGVLDILNLGVTCFSSFGFIHKKRISNHFMKTCEELKQFRVGTFDILPFCVQHDAASPLGYLLKSGDEKLLFATDTYYLKYRFEGLTTIAIECNYIPDLLYKNIAKGVITERLKNRILFSHFSLQNVIKFLKANDLSKLKEVYLMHLSTNNSDAKIMKAEVQRVVGCPVYVCEE